MDTLSLTKEAKIHNEEKTVSLTIVAGKTGHFLTPSTKINSKWVEDLNVRLDTIKFLEENISRTLFETIHNSIFFNLSPTVMEIEKKNGT